MDQATTTGPDSNGWLQMTGNNVVVPRDTITISADMATKKTRKIIATTFHEGDAVLVTASFQTLSSGLVYMAYAEVSVPARQMSLQVQNFNCNRND
jgi:hypothetical protein